METLRINQKQTSKHSFFLLSIASLFLFSGCGLSDLTKATCDISGGDPHCSQEAAVQSNDADNCDTVAQKEEFKKAGSNPPRDKCVVMVAANNENPETCNKVKGGLMSYTKQDCTQAISDTAREPSTCPKLGGDVASCINKVAEKAIIDAEQLTTMKKKTPEDIAEVQRRLEELRKTNEMLSNVYKVKAETALTAIKGLGR